MIDPDIMNEVHAEPEKMNWIHKIQYAYVRAREEILYWLKEVFG